MNTDTETMNDLATIRLITKSWLILFCKLIVNDGRKVNDVNRKVL